MTNGPASPGNSPAEAAATPLPQLLEGPAFKIDPADRSVDAAYKILRRQFALFRLPQTGARPGMDPEHLHDMRVAVNRMRVALRLFREVLPPRRAASFRRDLRWIAATLGRVRDLDVHLLWLHEAIQRLPSASHQDLSIYETAVRHEHDRARKAMLKALGSRRYRRFIGRMDRFLTKGPARRPARPVARQPIREVAPRLILHRLGRVLRLGRTLHSGSSDEDLHRLRIQCKRLRYVSEFFVDLLGKPAGKLARRARRLQDALGLHQDAVARQRVLDRVASSLRMRRAADRRVYIGIGLLMAIWAERASEARAEFQAHWGKFSRKRPVEKLRSRLFALPDAGDAGDSRLRKARSHVESSCALPPDHHNDPRTARR